MRVERDWTLALLEFRLHAARDAELNATYAAGHRRIVSRLAALLVRAGVDAERADDGAVEIVALSNGWALEHLVLPDEATEQRYAGAAAAIIQSLRR